MRIRPTMNVSFAPTADHLSQIKRWLTDELNQTGEGYKHNWQLILSAHKRHWTAALLENGIAVGFAIWWELEFHIRLDIFCIEMTRRREGLGNYFFEELLQNFITKGKAAVELQCSPPESELYWRKHGFSNLPYQQKIGIGQNRWLYRVILKSASFSTLGIVGEFIALWEYEPSMVKEGNMSPKWIWQIELKVESDELLLPVIFPCRPDWQIQHIKDGVIKESTKTKYFNDHNAHSNNMLVIQSITKRVK